MDVTKIKGETERLSLRLYRPGDAANLASIYPDDDAVRYVPFGRVEGEQLDQMMSRRTHASFAEAGDRVFFIAEDKATGACVGEFALFVHNARHRGAELGYGVAPAHAGRGLATEGARAMLALGFGLLGQHRVIGIVDSRNAASSRVMAKAGLRLEAHHVSAELHKGVWCDELVYALVEDEWAGASDITWTS